MQQNKLMQNIAMGVAIVIILFMAVILAGFLTWVAVWVWSQV